MRCTVFVIVILSVCHTAKLLAILLNIRNFGCHGNEAWSGTNFTSTVKFADPDNPLLGAEMGVVSPIQAEILPIFCQNFQIFVAMATGLSGNRVWSGTNSCRTVISCCLVLLLNVCNNVFSNCCSM